jgi:L-aminopeptidase/D-esterase-like protein
MTEISRRRFGQSLAAAAAGWIAVESGQANERAAQDSGTLTDVPGLRVGHFTDSRRPTGCTAILFEPEATAAVDYDGSAPGSHLGVMLQPASPVERIHAMLLTGGGLFGLGAVPGVVRFLEERKVGHDWGTPEIRIPLVVGGVIADLEVGDGHIRPDAEAAYKACLAASTDPVGEGNVGAGAGGTVGKMLLDRGYGGMKGGLGTASLRLGDVVIGAMVVLNAVGDIVDWRTGKILAGARRPDGKGLADTVATLKELARTAPRAALEVTDPAFRSTTLVLVATNAEFGKSALSKIAMIASTGAARAINPYHTNGDGDSTFAVSTNRVKSEIGVSVAGALAAEVTAEAVVRAVKAARSVEGWPAYADVKW